jgi:hypothetical protein
MNSATRDDNRGELRLHPSPVSLSGDEVQVDQEVILQASPDGRTVVLVEVEERFSDHHATGPDQDVQHEISVAELIQLIRAHGARL